MNNKAKLYFGLTWIVTLAIAYALGWWSGVSRVTRMATDAAYSGFPMMLGVLALVAVISGVAAFRARGYLNRPSH